jgi:hypothetical protein
MMSSYARYLRVRHVHPMHSLWEVLELTVYGVPRPRAAA